MYSDSHKVRYFYLTFSFQCKTISLQITILAEQFRIKS